MNSDLLNKLEASYKSSYKISNNTPVLNFRPVTNSELDLHEKMMGFEFSNELRDLYRTANGTLSKSDDEPYQLFSSHEFNSIENSLRIYSDLKKFNETASQVEFTDSLQGRLYNDYYFNFKLGAIKHTEFHPCWFPLGSVRGISTYIMVDHSPGKNGKNGQVIFIDLGRKAIVLADSIQEYIEKIIKHAHYINKQEDDYKIMQRLAKGSIWKYFSKKD